MEMEAQLIAQAKGGNNDAFAQLVHLYGRRIYYAAYSFLHNVDDAADIVQEAFLRAYKNLSSFDASRSFYPWIYRIARNLCINTVKRASRRDGALPAEDLIVSNMPDPSAALLEQEEMEQLRKALAGLPEKQREIIDLKVFQDCSYAEMAEILDIPIGTVMSRLYGARLRLRELLMEVNT